MKDEHRRLSNNMDQTSIVMHIRHGVPAKDRRRPIRISDRVCLQGVGTKLFGSVRSQPLKKINNVVIVGSIWAHLVSHLP